MSAATTPLPSVNLIFPVGTAASAGCRDLTGGRASLTATPYLVASAMVVTLCGTGFPQRSIFHQKARSAFDAGFRFVYTPTDH